MTPTNDEKSVMEAIASAEARGVLRGWVSRESLLRCVRAGRSIEDGAGVPAWVKAANARAEEDLRLAGVLAFAGPSMLAEADWTAAKNKIERAWEALIEIQCREGWEATAIEESRRGFARVEKITEKLIDQGTTRWLAGMSSEGMSKPMAVFNPCSVERAGVIELVTTEDEAPERCFVNGVSAVGVRIFDRSRPVGVVPTRGDEDGVLSNGVVRVEVDEAGCVVSLQRAGSDGDWAENGVMNALVVVGTGNERSVEGAAEAIELLDAGPLRAAIRVRRVIEGCGTIVHTYVVDAGSQRVDVFGEVEWTSQETLWAAHLTGCGVVRTERMWVDVAESSRGLAVLSDAPMTMSEEDGALAVMLSDETGKHEFAFSLVPHEGNWQRENVDHEAEALGAPLMAYALNAGEAGALGTAWAPFAIELESPGAGVIIEAAEAGNEPSAFALRLRECRGRETSITVRWRIAVEDVKANLPIEHTHNATSLRLMPGGVVTLVVNRAFER